MSGFGRKGLGQPEQQHQPQPGYPAEAGLEGLRNSARSGFATQHSSGTVSRKVDAFVAAERAQRNQSGISDFATGYPNSAPPERSLWMAYLLWFLLGQVSAHRFYLGAYRSGFAQVGLFAFVLFLALSATEDSTSTAGPVVMVALVVWALWVVGDVFFIHRIHRSLCRRPGHAAAAFA